MSKTLAIFFGVGVLVVAIAAFFIFYGNEENHLELKGQIIKIRTGAIDEHNSTAVLDFRIENPSNVVFEVREVKVTAEQPNGDKLEGDIISKSDFKQLLDYNKFLGKQFNDGLSLGDKIGRHQTVDRMVAVRFEVAQPELEKAKQMRLWIEDMDRVDFETVKSLR
jgi:hypothetical protein